MVEKLDPNEIARIYDVPVEWITHPDPVHLYRKRVEQYGRELAIEAERLWTEIVIRMLRTPRDWQRGSDEAAIAEAQSLATGIVEGHIREKIGD